MKAQDYTIKGYSLLEMRNENEKLVCRMMEKIIDKGEVQGMCLCGICLEDVYGIVLNKLPPRYKHSRTIILKHRTSDAELKAAILKAMELVKKSPNHS